MVKRTPEEQAAFAARAAARAEVLPPRSARNGGRVIARPRKRKRSTRYYLAKAEDYLEAVDAGVISSADGARRVGMVKLISEVYLAHKVLEMQSQDAPIDVTPAPEEEYQPPALQAHRTKRVAVKRGTDRHGSPVDEKTVTIESSQPGDDPEPDAEIEALT